MNPLSYRNLKKLVQWEDDKKYQNNELYERKLLPDTNSFTKKVWKARFKKLIASIVI